VCGTSPFGGLGFFDATYAEMDISFAYGSATTVTDIPEFRGNGSVDGSAVQLGFSLLGKYPIKLGALPLTLFPLLGFDYNRVLSVKDKDGNSADNPGDSSQLGILAGAGIDFSLPFSDALFLRAEALLHVRLTSKATDDSVTGYRVLWPGVNIDTTLGVGPRIKVAVGYRFF